MAEEFANQLLQLDRQTKPFAYQTPVVAFLASCLWSTEDFLVLTEVSTYYKHDSLFALGSACAELFGSSIIQASSAWSSSLVVAYIGVGRGKRSLRSSG